MKIEPFQLGTIPAILYGEPTDKIYLFLHGQMGHKEEAEAFSQVVCSKGYQVLSIDLPGHGARQDRDEELTPWAAIPEIRATLDWLRCRWKTVSLRANSIGAYFAMLSFHAPDHALLVSPVLDMEALILTMMDWAGVTEQQLQAQGEIPTSFGQTLSWKYLCWVREHPVYDWSCPVYILYGSRDNITPLSTVEEYTRRHNAQLTKMEGGEHWFHTPQQLAALRIWEDSFG
ncbi:MAG: alpha/beta hydrolase [Lawsonibacter sp.]|jgi:pimeloyl-ACP methyl ester carboxylesterase